MTISELIERLEALKAEHGDIQVEVCEDHYFRDPDPEWQDHTQSVFI